MRWNLCSLLAALLGGLLVPTRAHAQAAGSFAGDFVGVEIIKTITCSTGDVDLSCSSGGSALLGATIKLPAAKSKMLPDRAALQTATLTQTGVLRDAAKQSTGATA